MPSEFIQVTRVIEYYGPKEWVEQTLAKGAVPANGVWDNGDMTIKSGIVQWHSESGQGKKEAIIIPPPQGDRG